MAETGGTTGALAGLRVLDLSRVLAGPWATQILGDLGAEIIKIEEPRHGDDTRRWGPPFLDDGSGDSAYFAAANRNKHSVAIDISRTEGADLVRALAATSDVVIENFRVGGLAKYGLDQASLRAQSPRLIYCSITGFGQDGPYRDRGGYDFLIQGMSGLMSVTGRPDAAPGGGPLKVGVPVSDLFTGLYATIAILAALRHRDATGEGQYIDCALFDTQVALLANQASNALNGGLAPQRLANAHPTLVPYQDYACADGEILVALGNDRQFQAFARLIEAPELAEDARFATNAARHAHRAALDEALGARLARWPVARLAEAMAAAGLPGGKVNSVGEALADPQIAHRGLVQSLTRGEGPPVRVPGFPAKLSATPPSYRRAPPRLGADTEAVLAAALGLDAARLAALKAAGIIPRPR
ncbi:CaiB/BaiF CoA transferase family protein [Sphingomonas morindae]|uniref:CoA transferase n=1 Tax=Sphingomonas morindae TaxID=1541170 RepID=A0ABY4X9Z0_9SPHN|nr:CoA transferase [Sphingomonas morindae]USI73772.1 CoA transferase [Sphingomonas morindae]